MKITKRQLRQVIREEFNLLKHNLLSEQTDPPVGEVQGASKISTRQYSVDGELYAHDPSVWNDESRMSKKDKVRAFKDNNWPIPNKYR